MNLPQIVQSGYSLKYLKNRKLKNFDAKYRVVKFFQIKSFKSLFQNILKIFKSKSHLSVPKLPELAIYASQMSF